MGPIISSLILWFLLLLSPAIAATYYVSRTGNDANTCATAQTITTPKLTLASAVPCLAAGDTLYIRAGIWTELINITGKTGTVGNVITIAGYPGETVILRPNSVPANGFALMGLNQQVTSYWLFKNMFFDGVNVNTSYESIAASYIAAGCPLNALNLSGQCLTWFNQLVALTAGLQVKSSTVGGPGPSFITFDGVEIANWPNPGIYISAPNITVKNSHLHHARSLNINFFRFEAWYQHDTTGGVLFDNVEMDHCGGGATQFSPGPNIGIILRNSSIHHNATLSQSFNAGVHILDSDSTTKVYNNLIYANGFGAGGGGQPGLICRRCNGSKFWNNTITANATFGLDLQQAGVAAVVQNNIMYGNGGSGFNDGGSGTVADHNLTTNPLFVNAAAADFHLLPASSAINAGRNLITDGALTAPSLDRDGVARPTSGNWEIGAYEAGGAPDVTPPAPPTGLRISQMEAHE